MRSPGRGSGQRVWGVWGTRRCRRRCPLPCLTLRGGATSSPRTSSSGIVILVAAKTKAFVAGLWRGGGRKGFPGSMAGRGGAEEPLWGQRWQMPGELINPLRTQPALGNLCECGPRVPLRHPRPTPFSGDRARVPAQSPLPRSAPRGRVALGSRRERGWRTRLPARGGQCTEGSSVLGPWGGGSPTFGFPPAWTSFHHLANL